MKKKVEAILLIYALLLVGYCIHVFSFVEGYNLSTDKQYDVISSALDRNGISASEILYNVSGEGPMKIHYPYIFYKMPGIDMNFNASRMEDWIVFEKPEYFTNRPNS